MTEKGLNQNDLAAHFKVDQSTVSRWLAGTVPSFARLEAIASYIGGSWEWLIVGEEGLKALGGLSPRDPIIVRLADRDFMIALYDRSDDDIPIYRVGDTKFKELRLARARAKQEKERAKL